jgi:hypothetical protein
MNKHLLTIGLILTASSVFSQNIILDFHKKNLADFINVEKSLNSQRVIDSSTDYVSGDDLAQPVLFRRTEKHLPDLIVYYYFKKDSTLADILYEWDEKNCKNYNDTAIISQQEITAFIDKYKELYDEISKVYGEGSKDGDLDTYSKTKEVERQDVWETKDNTEIELYITLSSEYSKSAFATINPTYRIRLYIKNTKT